VLGPADDDILVTVAHPWANIETTLRAWIENGPGPRRFVTITAARRRNGEPVPLDAIPLEYRNNPESRRLQRMGLLPAPWGPPPDELQMPGPPPGPDQGGSPG
jgi:hypothetical protein